MSLPTNFPDQEWKYYDFKANWKTFLKAWKTPSVQDVLYEDMQNWCKDHAYYEPDGTKPVYKRGDPLWKFSRTDYWATKHMDAANDHVEKNNCIAKFKRTMEQQGRKFKNEETLQDAFYEICFDEICADFAPKPDTLESMIMIMGGQFLYPAMAEAAMVMGLDDYIVQTDEGVVLLPGKKMVFDFTGYYFDVVEGGSSLCLQKDEDYDELLECFEDLDI